jgi:hypothetical protein
MNKRKECTIVRNICLTALDDPQGRERAKKYGAPDDLLREDWIPQIPGITSAGSYEEYARNPGKWIYGSNA